MGYKDGIDIMMVLLVHDFNVVNEGPEFTSSMKSDNELDHFGSTRYTEKFSHR